MKNEEAIIREDRSSLRNKPCPCGSGVKFKKCCWNKTSQEKMEKKLADLISGECRENDSNTPDFILAEFMMNCLNAFELASNKREVWFGVHLDILNNWKKLILTAIGEASMCWSNIEDAGVFDSTKALQIGEKLLRDMKEKKGE